MRRPLLAAALVLALALAFTRARADDGAYGSLVSLATAAATDKGPDASDGAPAADATLKDALNDPGVKPPAPRAARPVRAAPPRRDDPEGAVSAPPPSSPRFWTRLYSVLTPSWHAVPSLAGGFEPAAVSTASARPAPAAVASPLSRLAAASAGERRGLNELISSFPAPDEAQ